MRARAVRRGARVQIARPSGILIVAPIQDAHHANHATADPHENSAARPTQSARARSSLWNKLAHGSGFEQRASRQASVAAAASVSPTCHSVPFGYARPRHAHEHDQKRRPELGGDPSQARAQTAMKQIVQWVHGCNITHGCTSSVAGSVVVSMFGWYMGPASAGLIWNLPGLSTFSR